MFSQKIQQFKNSSLYTPIFMWLFVLFLGIHLILFNVNQAEWGDSYRIMRAGEILKTGTYPSDEKRPPLVSLILSTRPLSVDPTTYGRIVLLGFSLASLITFYLLASAYIKDNLWLNWVTLAFILNNVYLYWSLRIMADVPFSFFVLAALLLYTQWYKNGSKLALLLSGLVCGLAVLTRFEGYILSFALFVGVFGKNLTLQFKEFINRSWFIVGAAVLVLPYLIYRNPLTSSYFEEPGSRTYDLNMVAIYLISLLSLFGVPYLFYFLAHVRWNKSFIRANLPHLLFVLIELLLILWWPAAVPRLFVPIIPILLIYLGIGAQNYFNQPFERKKIPIILGVSFFLLATYALGQYNYKLQFLLLDKKLFVFNAMLQAALIFIIYAKKQTLFVWLSVAIMALWSYSIIFMHKDIFISVKSAADYAGKNLTGNIGYNDVSAVSDWYLNFQYQNPDLKGLYYNTEKKQFLEEEKLKQAGVDYLLITNEHNTTMTLDLKKRPYLTEEQVFEYNVNGKNFSTRIVKVL